MFAAAACEDSSGDPASHRWKDNCVTAAQTALREKQPAKTVESTNSDEDATQHVGTASAFACLELPDRIKGDSKGVTLVIREEFYDPILDIHDLTNQTPLWSEHDQSLSRRGRHDSDHRVLNREGRVTTDVFASDLQDPRNFEFLRPCDPDSRLGRRAWRLSRYESGQETEHRDGSRHSCEHCQPHNRA